MRQESDSAERLDELLTMLLPPAGFYPPKVSSESQAGRLQKLDEFIQDESFYVVFNLLTKTFDHVNGVNKWLGYPNQTFTPRTYLHIIDPQQAVVHNLVANSMYRLLCGGNFKLQFASQRYISRIALRHYNGSYIEFKKTTSIFQYDANNRLLAQLNEFTKIGSYQTGMLDLRITETNGIRQKDIFEKQVFEGLVRSFLQEKYFSKTELEVLSVYVSQPGISSRGISERLGLAPATVNEFNKRILAKARETFTRLFSTARDVAFYLKEEKLI